MTFVVKIRYARSGVRDPYFYVSGLLSLPETPDPVERRSAWRQSLTSISRAAQEEGPSPLDGLDPNALARGVQVALQAGLADDLDWLSSAASGVALYVLANALPPGQEQRELGRRMLAIRRRLLDRAKRFDQPMRELVNHTASVIEHADLDGVGAMELTLRLGEAEAQLHHMLRQSAELQKGIDAGKIGEKVARLRESAGLNAMKGGPLRPKS